MQRDFQNSIRKLTHAGVLAGRRLHFVAGIERAGYKGSFNKADELIPYFKLKDLDGKIISTAKGAIYRAWKKFHSVAHLWAAYYLLPVMRDLYIDPFRNIDDFISVAEWFRNFGENHKPRNTGMPILDPEATWCPPNSFKFERYTEIRLNLKGEFNKANLERYL
jgi:hypothetical protein